MAAGILSNTVVEGHNYIGQDEAPRTIVVESDCAISFGYNCSAGLSYTFIQADRPHVLQLRVASNLQC
jgi:hypothetical protein